MRKESLQTKGWEIPKHTVQAFREKNSQYCLCIPVLNEGERIKKQLKRLIPYSKIVDIIIADWGSTDGSTDPKLLKKARVRTLLTLKEPGKQASQLRMAFSHALQEGYLGIIQIDGNNKDGVEAIPKFIKALDDGYDYLQGSRFIEGGRAINTPLLRWIAVRLIASPLLTLSAGKLYTDVTNGFRAYSKKYLLHPKVQPFRNIFTSYELNMYLTVRANQLGLKTKEVPVERRYTPGKVHTKITLFKGNFNFFSAQLKVVFGLYNPSNY